MTGFSRTCQCGRRALPGETRCALHLNGSSRPTCCLECGRRTSGGAPYCSEHTLSEQERRLLAQPWRVGYSDPMYARNRPLVFKRDGGRCVRCGFDVSPRAYICDHIIPLSEGGTSAIENLQTLCRSCSKRKTRNDRRRRARTGARERESGDRLRDREARDE